MSGHLLTRMGYSREGSSHRAVVRQKQRTRRHWMAVYTCPVCGRVAKRLDNTMQAGATLACDGLTARVVSLVGAQP